MSDDEELKKKKAELFRDFMHAAKEMRAAQKFYFKHRGIQAQNLAMQWEREFDRLMVAVEDMRKGKPQATQEQLL